jgi:hypothetical protein
MLQQFVLKARSFLRALWSFLTLGDAPLATYLNESKPAPAVSASSQNANN